MTDVIHCLHATVSGIRVSFRYFMIDQADRLDLKGWVRNLWNGSVEVTAEGPRQNLDQLLLALKAGPPMAVVSEVDYEWHTYTGEFSGFDLANTA
jgi:acylphosphatase